MMLPNGAIWVPGERERVFWEDGEIAYILNVLWCYPDTNEFCVYVDSYTERIIVKQGDSISTWKYVKTL